MRSRGGPTWVCPTIADKTGRPDDYQPLTSAEIVDLVAFLASWRQGGSAYLFSWGHDQWNRLTIRLPRPRTASLRRRTLFRWLTYGLGAIATVILAIPFVGYILG